MLIGCFFFNEILFMFIDQSPSLLQLPAGAVSMFGSGPNPLAAAIKKQRKDSDEVKQAYYI